MEKLRFEQYIRFCRLSHFLSYTFLGGDYHRKGMKRPLYRGELAPDAVEVFRFGDFARWIIEWQDGHSPPTKTVRIIYALRRLFTCLLDRGQTNLPGLFSYWSEMAKFVGLFADSFSALRTRQNINPFGRPHQRVRVVVAANAPDTHGVIAAAAL